MDLVLKQIMLTSVRVACTSEVNDLYLKQIKQNDITELTLYLVHFVILEG